MSRFVAFLGGINVGGHRVVMERLRAEFEALALRDVWTFIASGNVVFSAPGHNADALEARIETHLSERLGYRVPTFLRAAAAVVEVATREPFDHVAEGDTHVVGFLRAAPSTNAALATEALSNEQDTLVVVGSEIHWRIHGGFSDSSIKSNVLAKTIGQPWTVRNTKSLRTLAARLGT